jgi:membrane protein implicated in regulation of membrane protease activity
VSAGRVWLLAGGVLAVAALGLPWTGQLAGAAHPARVAVVAGLVLAVAGLRTGRDRLLTAAVGAGAVGVLLGGPDATPGRLALAGAVACLVLGSRVIGRRLLPEQIRSSST